VLPGFGATGDENLCATSPSRADPEAENEVQMRAYICETCGVQYPPGDLPPESCLVCQDERQYVGHNGQRWTTLEQLQGQYRNAIVELEAGLHRITTEPEFAVGQGALLVRTEAGNLLWDCLSYLDQATIEAVSQLGGLAAIAISHPHFYGSLVEWSEAFGGIPVYLSELDRAYLVRKSRAVIHFHGNQREPLPGLRIVRLGGHFHGSTVLHWPAGAEGRGALLTGDTIGVVEDNRWVTFLYSFPNRIPLPAGVVEEIARRVEELEFDRLYDGGSGEILAGAKESVSRSADRYRRMLDGSWQRR
jgi:glyoxylase-like metal-dependent hydrolase (beta-lactamase superfamily II)